MVVVVVEVVVVVVVVSVVVFVNVCSMPHFPFNNAQVGSAGRSIPRTERTGRGPRVGVTVALKGQGDLARRAVALIIQIIILFIPVINLLKRYSDPPRNAEGLRGSYCRACRACRASD